MQLEAISSHPIICYLGEDTKTLHATASFQISVESKVSPRPPSGKRAQLPSASPHNTCALEPSPDLLQVFALLVILFFFKLRILHFLWDFCFIPPIFSHMLFPELDILEEINNGEQWIKPALLQLSFVLILRVQRHVYVFGAMSNLTFKLFFFLCNEKHFGVTCIRLNWSLKQSLLWFMAGHRTWISWRII